MASIYAHLRDLLRSEEYCDIKLRLSTGIIHHHRAVISQSPVFKSMITSTPVGSQIDLSSEDAYIMFRVIQFLYNGTYYDYEYINVDRPSYVVFMSPEKVERKLQTLPCATKDLDYGDEDDDGDYIFEEKGDSDGDSLDGDAKSMDEELEHDLSDDKVLRPRLPNLLTSLQVYVMAAKYEIPALKLLARDRFYRTAEKVLLFCPNKNQETVKADPLASLESSPIMKGIYNEFYEAVDELYETVPESDETMRSIPALLIAAKYHGDVPGPDESLVMEAPGASNGSAGRHASSHQIKKEESYQDELNPTKKSKVIENLGGGTDEP
ncbi:hypothetical protein F5X99DRAFT_153070 [Biscogniauxia marginata]|nr:hypothetical protein F5X99DRAFT_153070 [Biscogniauxia marginata]